MSHGQPWAACDASCATIDDCNITSTCVARCQGPIALDGIDEDEDVAALEALAQQRQSALEARRAMERDMEGEQRWPHQICTTCLQLDAGMVQVNDQRCYSFEEDEVAAACLAASLLSATPYEHMTHWTSRTAKNILWWP